MNKTFRSVWNASKQTYVAAAEIVRACGRPGTAATTLGAAACLFTSLAAQAQAQAQATAPPAPATLPSGGQVSAGQASISSSGTNLLIQQGSDRAAINWQSFNVGRDAQVTFQQPGAASVTLNRVLGNDPSQILGRISANGQVILTNPAGVYFGKDARVDVGGLVATTHRLSDADFMAGKHHYERDGSTAGVANDGTLQAGLGGYIALLAPEVRNQGVVVAQMGSVAMAAGESIDLHFDAQNRLTSLRVDPGELATLVDNRHAVQAPGGLVILSAQSLERLQGSVVRNSGVIEATGLQHGSGGRIVLSAGAAGTVENAGTLDASSHAGHGGELSLQGGRIALQGGSMIDARGAGGGGDVRIGGGWQGGTDPLLHATAQPAQAATTVTMAAGARIDASATASGDGGSVVLWTGLDRVAGSTTALGTVLARGGALGGNGGRVETSGHTVSMNGFHVDTLAPRGQAGLWLIDPYDYTIGASQAATIANALNSSSVTVTTASNNASYGSNGNSASSGDINLAAAITKTGNVDTTLTLQAARHIVVQSGANIGAIGSGKLNLQLTADTALNGTGIIQMGASIATQGGWLKFGNNQSITLGGAATLVGGDVFFNGGSAQSLNTAGGQLDIFGETIISNTAGLSISTGAGNANFWGMLNSGNAYGFVAKTSGGSWDQARIDAKNGTAGGSAAGDSYLVNITSRLENAIAGLAAGYKGAWIGAWRPNSNAYGWTWADGPEGGKKFFTQSSSGGGTATTGYYSNFGSGEPNGSLNATRSNTESVGQFFGTAGQWNDLTHTTTYSTDPSNVYAVMGFVRETNLAASTLTITSTGNVSFNKAVGTSKTLANLTVTASQIAFGGALNLDATGATLTHSGAGVIAGAVSGSGGLTKNGAGTLALTANGSYSGGTRINAGGLGVYANTALGGGALTLAGGTALTLGRAVTQVANDISLNGNVAVALDSGVQFLLVGGGGGGGADGGGGGGGGGLYEASVNAGAVSSTATVGSGGVGGVYQGINSTGGGASRLVIDGVTYTAGGGSGAASGPNGTNGVGTGGSGTSAGGNGGAGATGNGTRGGNGYNGSTSGITGSTVYFGGGGGGGVYGAAGYNSGQTSGGWNGGGAGAYNNDNTNASWGTNGSSYYGGGGGGGSAGGSNPVRTPGGAGGAGTVIVRYMGPQAGSGGTVSAGSGAATGHTLHTFNSSATLTLNALAPTLAGVISGTGGMTVNASNGTLTFGGANTYSGGTTVTGGTVKTTATSALGSGAVNLANTAGVLLNASTHLALGSLSGGGGAGGNVTLGNGARLSAGALNTDTRYDGVISGAGALEKTGTGTLVLTANSSYSGATTISGGTLVLRNNAPATGSSGFAGPGALRIEPAATSFSGPFSTSGWTLASTLASLTLGKAGNTADITVASGYGASVAGPIGIYGRNIAINGALTAGGGNTITLQSTGNVTQSAALSAAQLLLLGGNVTLTNAANAVDTLAADGVGTLAYVDSQALTLGSVGATDGIKASGTVAITTVGGDLTVAKSVATSDTTASALVLNADAAKAAGNAAGGNLVIGNGATVSVGTGGTARLYSGSVAGSSGLTALLGAASGRFRYNTDESSNGYTTALASGLNALYREAPSISVTVDNKAMTYGDNLPALTGSVTAGSLVNGDSLHYAVAGTKSGSGNYTAGNHTLSEDRLAALGYQVTATNGLLAVAQREIGVAGLQVANKVYDGSDTATLGSAGNASGKLAGDTVTIDAGGASARFDAGKHVGANKAVTVTGLALGGADGANYRVGSQAATASITPATLVLSAVTDTKVYDGTTTSGGTVSVGGLVGGDTLGGSLTQSFDSKNVQGTGGSRLSVDNGFSVNDGNGGANYSVTRQTAPGSITPKTLTATGLTSADKVYDATTIATVAGTATLAGAIAAGSGSSADGAPYNGDSVSLGGTASAAFNSKDVTSANTVSFSGLRLTGADAGNYTLVQSPAVTQHITPAPLTVRANDDAKLITENDSLGFNGVSYSGFVGGEGAGVLGGSWSISRSNTGVEAAGTYGGVLVPSGLSSSNYAISFTAGKFTIVPANQLLLRVSNVSDTYGTGTTHTVSAARYLDADGVSIVDLLNAPGASVGANGNDIALNDGLGGTASLTLTPQGALYSAADLLRVGSYQLGATGFIGNPNFTALTVVGAHQVNAAALTASATAGVSKTYDGSTAMHGLTMGLTGKQGSDAVTVDGNGAFDSRNAGSALSYTVTDLRLSGADAGNYYLSQGGSFTGSNGAISARTLTVSYGGVNKVYNGQTTATVTTSDDRIVGDALAIQRSASFSDKNAGTGKLVDVSGVSLSGADAGNYVLAATTGATSADIAKATLLIAGIVGGEQTYNASTVATLDTSNLQKSGLVNGDLVTVTVTGSFADANAGYGKAITLTSSFGGADAGNYDITAQTGAHGTILHRQVAVTATGVSKVYDGTTAMNDISIGLGAVDGVAESGLIGGQSVLVSGTGSFSSASAGSGKSYTLSGLQLSGADAGNYMLAGGLTSVSGNDGQILQKTLTLTGIHVDDKVYDGSTAAQLSQAGTLFGVVGSDAVSASTSGASFSDRHAGTGKTVTLSGIALSGADAGNYTIASTATSTASITPKTVAITGLIASDKVYDGSTAASIAHWGSVSTGVGSETLVLEHGTASFANKSAGSGKTVTATGYALADGSGLASDYQLSSTSISTTAAITPKAITVSGMTAQDRVYDGSIVATLVGGALAGVIHGDELGFSGQTGVFADKNVGAAKTVLVSGLSLHGADAGNYSVSQPSGLTADVTRKLLTITGLQAGDKVYDGGTDAGILQWGSVSTGVAGESLVLEHGTAGFADKNAGSAKTVTATGYRLADGSGLASNYQLASASATTTAAITPKAITVSGLTAQDKVYDGSTAARLVGGALAGVVEGDDLGFAGQTGAFADKNAGSAKTVTVNGLTLHGADAGNYSVSQPTGLNASITPKAITVAGMTAQDKVYDGSTAARLVGGALAGVVEGDDLGFAGQTGAFADKNAGSAKTVTVSGLSLHGADAGNYSVSQPTGLSASITPKAISVSGLTAQDKVYDGSTAARLVGGALVGVVEGDDLGFAGQTGAFADKNAGSAKAVTVNGLALHGADAGNYSVSQPTALSASITPKAISVAGMTAQDKVYDGSTAARLVGGSLTDVVEGDDLGFAGQTGTFADKNVGSAKAVNVSGLVLNGTDAGNYRVSQPTGLTAHIDRRPVTVTAEDQEKRLLASDPALTYQVEPQGSDRGLLSGESLTGALNRESGEKAGTYRVLQGSLTDANNGNYAINYVPAALTIMGTAPGGTPDTPLPPVQPNPPLPPATAPLEPLPPASGLQPPGTASAPSLMGVDASNGMAGNPPAPGLPAGDSGVTGTTLTRPAGDAGAATTPSADGISVTLMQPPSPDSPGSVSVTIPEELVASGSGFSFELPAALAEAAQAAMATGPASASTPQGAALPGWLAFNPKTLVFSAADVPDGAFPMQVLLVIGDWRVVIVISERQAQASAAR